MLKWRESWHLNETEPPGVPEKRSVLVSKRNWAIFVTHLNVLDHADPISQRLKWYTSKTDLFKTFLRRLAST